MFLITNRQATGVPRPLQIATNLDVKQAALDGAVAMSCVLLQHPQVDLPKLSERSALGIIADAAHLALERGASAPTEAADAPPMGECIDRSPTSRATGSDRANDGLD